MTVNESQVSVAKFLINNIKYGELADIIWKYLTWSGWLQDKIQWKSAVSDPE